MWDLTSTNLSIVCESSNWSNRIVIPLADQMGKVHEFRHRVARVTAHNFRAPANTVDVECAHWLFKATLPVLRVGPETVTLREFCADVPSRLQERPMSAKQDATGLNNSVEHAVLGMQLLSLVASSLVWHTFSFPTSTAISRLKRFCSMLLNALHQGDFSGGSPLR